MAFNVVSPCAPLFTAAYQFGHISLSSMFPTTTTTTTKIHQQTISIHSKKIQSNRSCAQFIAFFIFRCPRYVVAFIKCCCICLSVQSNQSINTFDVYPNYGQLRQLILKLIESDARWLCRRSVFHWIPIQWKTVVAASVESVDVLRPYKEKKTQTTTSLMVWPVIIFFKFQL